MRPALGFGVRHSRTAQGTPCMNSQSSSTSDKVTLREAFADLGWFWLVFTAIVGGPSLLALLQTVFIDHRLVDALQWIVDGYNAILTVLGGALEPHLRALVDAIGRLFNWEIRLHPHWRPLLVLAVLFPSSVCRSYWKLGNYGAAVGAGFILSAGALIGSVAAGVVALDGSFLSLALTGAIPTATLVFATGIAMACFDPEKTLRRWPNWLLIPGLSLALGGVAFAIATLSLRDPKPWPPGAGLLAFAFIVFTLGGVPSLLEGGRFMRRMGLTVLGGFIAAGAILAADALIKFLIA